MYVNQLVYVQARWQFRRYKPFFDKLQGPPPGTQCHAGPLLRPALKAGFPPFDPQARRPCVRVGG